MILDPTSNDVSAWGLLYGVATEHIYLNLSMKTGGLKVEIEALSMW